MNTSPINRRAGIPLVLLAGIFWSTSGILYRLISPAEFGLLSMAIPLVLLPRMCTALGLSIATVQRETLSDQQCASLFTIQLVLGVLAAMMKSLTYIKLDVK